MVLKLEQKIILDLGYTWFLEDLLTEEQHKTTSGSVLKRLLLEADEQDFALCVAAELPNGYYKNRPLGVAKGVGLTFYFVTYQCYTFVSCLV